VTKRASKAESGRLEFEAEIRPARQNGAWVEVPFDIEDIYGTRGQVKVRATFDGEAYSGSIAPMGDGCHALGMTKALRAATGKDIGDTVRVTIERDATPRIVEVPPDLEAALAAHAEARAFFDGLAYTPKKEYAQWIAGAKRQETRERRLAQAIEKLGRGEKL
jgi:hypothetical protein